MSQPFFRIKEAILIIRNYKIQLPYIRKFPKNLSCLYLLTF